MDIFLVLLCPRVCCTNNTKRLIDTNSTLSKSSAWQQHLRSGVFVLL